MANDINDIFRGLGQSVAGQGSLTSGPGWLWQGAGKSGEWAAKQFTKAFPKEIAGALQKGIADGNLSGLLGEAFANAPFAAFKQKILDTFKSLGSEISSSWEKADQAAFNYGKRVGLAGDQVARLRNEMIRFSNEAQIGIKFGKSIEEAIALQEKYTLAVGRNIRLSNEQTKDYLALASVVGDDMAVKFTTSLDNFGMSATEAGEMMSQMFSKSVKQGITLDKYAQNVSDHLTMAQKYTFKNGVNGLMSMAEKAAKLRVDMNMVAQMAEKLNTIGGAVDASAQLQVLGGAFTQFADPMKLLYSSLNDMEGLQDELARLTNSMGRFNRDTGEIEIATFDKLRLKQAAAAMGADYGKLIEQTTTQARRNEIEYQMRGLSNIPDEYKELLLNSATFQNGVAGVRGKNGEFKALSNLENADFETLVSNSKTDSQNIAEIAEMLRGMTTIREGEQKAKDNLAAQKYATQAESIKNVYDMIGHNAEALNKLITMQLGAHIWQSVGSPMARGGIKAAKGLVGKLLKLNSKGGIIRTHDDGGYISDGPSGKEMIMNSAQHGEFVVNKEATAKNLPLLTAINGGGIFGMGGGMAQMSYMSILLPHMIDSLKESKKIPKSLQGIQKTMKYIYADDGVKNRYLKMYHPKIHGVQEKFNNVVGKVGNVAGKVMPYGAGAISGVVAGIGAWNQYEAKGIDITNKGKAVGGTVGKAVGAAAATGLLTAIPMIGPILGPMLGPAIGGAIGEAVGETIGKGNQSRRNKKYLELRNDITNEEGRVKFSALKGNFSVREMNELKKALSDGVIGENELKIKHLKEKLISTGNANLLNKKKYANGGLLYGASHENGGIMVNEAEGGEYIVNKEATSRSMNILTKINDGSLNDNNIKSREPMGKQMKVRSEETASSQNVSKDIKVKPIDINISGSIKLESNGQNFDISKELMNNPFFISKLTELITKQINIDDNHAFDKKSYYRRYTSI